jgi:ATP-binding cassette subfamily C protein CydD
VLLARPDAREDELQSVLDRAWVSEFLPLLPQGVDTVVGDQAAGLSVGQAQRVAVARALLNPCQLMLLDEPAASLDAHSEQRVMQRLTPPPAANHADGHPPAGRDCRLGPDLGDGKRPYC